MGSMKCIAAAVAESTRPDMIARLRPDNRVRMKGKLLRRRPRQRQLFEGTCERLVFLALRAPARVDWVPIDKLRNS